MRQAVVGAEGSRARLREEYRAGLAGLGLPEGAVVLVQAAYSRISEAGLGGFDGQGPEALIDALLDRVGPFGTLVAYAATPENSRTSPGYVHATEGMGPDELLRHEAAMRPFDPLRSPVSPSVGVLSETLRRRPGSLRSTHPHSSFVAFGLEAKGITGQHRLEHHLGPDSPVGELYRQDGWGLLLGVSWSVFTPFHLADYRVQALPRKRYHAKIATPGADPGADQGRWISFEDLDLHEGHFGALGALLEPRERELGVRRGRVGRAEAMLVPVRAAVDAATELLASGTVVARPWR